MIVNGCVKETVIELLLYWCSFYFYFIDFDRFVCFYLPVSLLAIWLPCFQQENGEKLAGWVDPRNQIKLLTWSEHSQAKK